MKYTKIITHDGLFHADEVLAIAFLRLFKIASENIVIVRSKRADITEKDLLDPTVLILDAGLVYDPNMGNFDHHQRKELKATNMLVLEYFLLGKEKMIEKLSYSLFNYVSDVDRGIRSKIGESAGFNAIVKNFNGLEDGFFKALDLVQEILEQYVRNAESAIKNEEAWKGFERIADGKIVVMKKEDPFVADWKRIGGEEGVQLLVCPNQKNDGTHNIISRDTDVVKIHKHPNQTFLHNSQFFAIYGAYESAITHAEEMVK